MNARRQFQSGGGQRGLIAAAIALTAAWLTGCSSTPYKQGDKTSDATRAVAVQVDTENEALAAALATLNNLVEKPAANLDPQFRSFSSALDVLVAAVQRTQQAGNQWVHNDKAFVASWDKQLTTITNAEVRGSSEARKTEVANQFDAAHKRYLQTQEALRSLMGYLQDIRKALSTDLTLGGIEAVKGLVSNAKTTAGKVQADLAQTAADLKALSTAMSSTAGPGTRPSS